MPEVATPRVELDAAQSPFVVVDGAEEVVDLGIHADQEIVVTHGCHVAAFAAAPTGPGAQEVFAAGDATLTTPTPASTAQAWQLVVVPELSLPGGPTR